MRAALAGVRKAVRWTAFALLALLVATPLAQVVMRGVFNVPMSGAEELARYFLICLTFIAASHVTERGGQILGSLFLTRADSETAKLRLLYVEKDARGLGLATKLIEKSIQFARDKHYHRLTLFTTHENESARRIYQRNGFRKVGEEPTDLFGNGLIGEMWELGLY